MIPLSRYETTCYFIIWISGVIIALYHLYKVGEVFDHRRHEEYDYDDFKQGWHLLGRYKDTTDYEWKIWTRTTLNILPWLVVNLFGAETIRYFKHNELLTTWYAGVTTAFIFFHFRSLIAFCFILQVYLFYLCITFQKQSVLWILGYFLRNFFKPEEWIKTDEDEQYLVMLTSSWMILRCLCCCIDTLKKQREHYVYNEKYDYSFNYFNKKRITSHFCNFIHILGYSFYLPTMIAGPLILFSDFNEGYKQPYRRWTFQRIMKFCIALSRCLFWYLVTEFALHYIYVNAVVVRPYLVQQLTPWELAGLGIGLGHFFLLKYIVFYGISCTWGAAEGYKTPEPPCCVSRVYLYSYMWRHFDQGLYKFMIKYMYVPVLTSVKYMKKTIASVICFSFIFFWHGGEQYVLYWTILNFIAITLEVLFKEIVSKPTIKNFFESNFKPENLRRLQCLLAAPLHYFSMVANYFFIGSGMEVGMIYMNQFFKGSLKANLVVIFFLYGASQSAVSVELWEKKRKKTE